LIPFLIFIDLFTKYLAKEYLQTPIILIENFFSLRYVENIGIAFSFPITWLPLKILTVIIIWFFLYYYFTEEKHKKNIFVDMSFVLILSWAIWNGYERIWNEKVIDFFAVQYFSVFNMADVFITLWVLLYIFAYYRSLKK
jgi:lipoprotein signal peptidase